MLAVLVTAGVTAWALLGKKLELPWPAAATAAAVQARQAPAIQVGRAAPHGELGPCTLCHAVRGHGNRPVPAIGAAARLPHAYQNGVCINCHRVATGLGNSVASAASEPPPTQQPPPAPSSRSTSPSSRQRQLPTLALSATPTELEWLGARLAPLDPAAARRLGLPADLGGLLVTRVQAEAAAVGLRVGDVLVAVNRTPVHDPQTLRQVTRDGALEGAVVQILRDGTLFRAVLSRAAEPAPATAPPPAVPAPPARSRDHDHDREDP